MESQTPELKLMIEAALLAFEDPLSIEKINLLFEEDEHLSPTNEEILAAIAELNEDYQNRGVECVEIASGYTLRVKQVYAPWLKKLWELKPPKYSRAFLETLALIAYQQPITRAEIEQVRGVSVSSHIIKTLLEREWIKVVGHRDVPGKPAVLATTAAFLDYFNLKSLSELPPLQEMMDLDKAGDQLEMQLQEALENVHAVETGDAHKEPSDESVPENQDTQLETHE